MINRRISSFLLVVPALVVCIHAQADPLTDRLEKLRPKLVEEFSVPLEHWRFQQPDIAGAEQPDFDDRGWTNVAPGFSWSGENTKVWFRSTITIPSIVAGEAVDGVPVRLDLGMDDDGELYLNGQLKEAFHWDEGQYTLSRHAQSGQTYHVAVRGINGPGQGQFHFARLYFDLLPEFDQYLNESELVGMLLDRVTPDEQVILAQALKASEGQIQFTDVTAQNLSTVRDQLAKARAALAPVAAITRKYDVYYVGHAHIDMNWLWPWPETIDVCHRTWNSAMNLMDEFPDFRFVQSQPGAYAAIQTNYPEEFERMQAMVGTGHWDPVGGLWDESDTDIPSGEGLARSFLLGQRYFKANFGRYALTGWLPDSFGHSWQLPQIMQLVGIKYFYHMRCGNDMEFTWWEAPDGSRVLKANTPNYDENVELNQLAVPVENEHRFNLPQSILVFGVGDHGGGPTREQILRIKSYQADPLLPRVHFASADEFFNQLASQPATAELPVVDTDLQYTLEGCYTTHADSKKAIRSSENNLYSAEVLSSLAALMGQPYPVSDFYDAWKPTTFAQFHDIACGSAIHSTYDWIHEQLAPAFKFEKEQTEKSLKFLTASVDTRGAGTEPIVVWNTLSSARTDVVKVAMPDAQKYHSVTDQQGREYPAQAMDGTNLVFIARDVPAFGHAVYFPGTVLGPTDYISLQETNGAYDVATPVYDLQISKSSGAISRLFLNNVEWNVFGDATDANAFQVMGDSGNAWELKYTGTNTTLLSEGVSVSVVDQGPVFVRVRVTHALGKSTYTQDIIAYGALPRIDVPTTVNWQEEHETLKIRLPLNEPHPLPRVQVPFGSIDRPTTGQECPGQKWMDVTENYPVPVIDAATMDLSALFNSSRAENFDGGGAAYPADLLPAAGIHQLGANQIPFNLPATQPKQPDNIAADGQEIKLPANTGQDTLYLLAANINGGRWTDLGFRLANGRIETRAFDLNDWIVNAYADNEAGITLPQRKMPTGNDQWQPKMWIVHLPLPNGATSIILPHDQRVHIFAATTAMKPAPAPQYGLSILNDCKYGFDIVSNIFRLTALRSSSDPDPHPDQGMQSFTYSLYPHKGGWRGAHTENQALALNIPLLATVTTQHAAAGQIPNVAVENIGGEGQLIVTALKHSEDGYGYILRFYEAGGHDTTARVDFDRNIQVEATDILERPLENNLVKVHGHSATLPVGHNQIVTLRIIADN